MQEFTDAFLPTPSPDRTGRLSDEDAFKSVPSEAEWTAHIYKPLVSVVLSTTASPETSIVDRSLSLTKKHLISPAALGLCLKTLLPAVCILVDSDT